MKEALIKSGVIDPVFWGEEIAALHFDKYKIPAMLDAALAGGAKKVLVHELSNGQGYGYMDEANGIWLPNENYPIIFNWSQAHLG